MSARPGQPHLYDTDGVRIFLWNQGVPLTRFAQWAKETTEALCVHAQRTADEAGRPYIYLEHNTTRDTGQTKEDLARAIAERDEHRRRARVHPPGG